MGSIFVDLDAVPEDGLSLGDSMKYFLSDDAQSLRNLLNDEIYGIVDIFNRQIFRQGMSEVMIALTPPQLPTLPFFGDNFFSSPKIEEIAFPILFPTQNGVPVSLGLMNLREFTDLIAPRLSRDEEIYALGISEAIGEVLGEDFANFLRGESVLSEESLRILLSAVRSGIFSNSNIFDMRVGQNNILEIFSEIINNFVSESSLDEKLKGAVVSLNKKEKDRLNEIISDLTNKIIAKTTERISVAL